MVSSDVYLSNNDGEAAGSTVTTHEKSHFLARVFVGTLERDALPAQTTRRSR